MIPARVVLYMLSFSGFLVSFMMRTDINIAMVAMAKLPLNNETAAVTSHCYTIQNASHAENITIIRPEVRLRILRFCIAHNFFFYLLPCIIIISIFKSSYFLNKKRSSSQWKKLFSWFFQKIFFYQVALKYTLHVCSQS